MLLELSLRSAISLLLVSVLAIGGCDRQSQPPEQANAAAPAADNHADNAAEAPAAPKIGSVDRSHKGSAAPDFAFKGPDGKNVTLAKFRGKPVLLNLWATWCAPCIKEMPTLDTLAGDLDGKVQVIALSQDLEGSAKVDPFFAKTGVKHLKPWLDPDIRFSTSMNANLPLTIFYDAQGKELWRMSGGFDWAGKEARALIAEAG